MELENEKTLASYNIVKDYVIEVLDKAITFEVYTLSGDFIPLIY